MGLREWDAVFLAEISTFCMICLIRLVRKAMGKIPAWNDIMLFYRLFIFCITKTGRDVKKPRVLHALLCFISDNKVMVREKSEN
jgi:hypothetical protein